MKKVVRILSIILIIALIGLIALEYNKINKTKIKIKNLKKIINQKQEINKEYVTLLEQNKDQNINEIIKEKTEKETKAEIEITRLQNEINQKQEQNAVLSEKVNTLQEQIDKELEKSTVKLAREITYNQFPEYPTGCESISLYILLKYNGIDTTPEEIINRLKLGSLPYDLDGTLYGGNPEIEFIGDPRNDYSYGVFNNPIAEVAKTFKEGVQSKQGLELEELLEIVKQNRPVMVWATVYNMKSEKTTQWLYKETGETILWKSNEHALVIVGYNDKYIIVSDPYNGRIMKYEKEKFKENYNYFGKRAVYY